MLNKHYMVILMLVALLLGPIAAFGAGYFHDKQCTAEEANRGRCDRLSDGKNNVLGWLSNASWALCFAAAVGSLASTIYQIVVFFDKDVKCWANRTGNNTHPQGFKCLSATYICPEKVNE